MTCFSLSTKSGPRSDDCADTVAFAPGGLESIVTSWYGPWTSVAQPLSAATATTRNVACRVMRNPFPQGGTPPRTPRLGSVEPGGVAAEHGRTAGARACARPYLAFPSTVSLNTFATENPTFLRAGILIG